MKFFGHWAGFEK